MSEDWLVQVFPYLSTTDLLNIRCCDLVDGSSSHTVCLSTCNLCANNFHLFFENWDDVCKFWENVLKSQIQFCSVWYGLHNLNMCVL